MKICCYLVLALLMGSQCLSAKVLNGAACEFIKAFDRKNETTFIENFLYMNHNAEMCIGGINCYRDIAKRTRPVNLALGKFLPRDPKILAITVSNLGNIRNWFAAISGLSVTLVDRRSIPKDNSGFIRVELVDEYNAPKITESKILQAKVEFKKFIQDERVKCLALNGDWANSGLEYSEVWIKTGQDYNQVSQCLTEELYHTFGVVSDPIGLASLYSDPMWLPEQTDTPNFTFPTARDILIMKILYDEIFLNGDDKKVSKLKVEHTIQRDCKPNGSQ